MLREGLAIINGARWTVKLKHELYGAYLVQHESWCIINMQVAQADYAAQSCAELLQ